MTSPTLGTGWEGGQPLGASASPSGSHPSDQAPAGLGAPRFDPSRVAWLHIRGQFSYHGEAYIVGSRAGLLALRAAIDEALEHGEGEAIAYANDGEGYAVTVRRTSRLRDMGSPPYIDRLSEARANYEREWMQKTQRHNFDLYAKIKRENAIATEARRAETTGSVHEGAGPQGHRPNTATETMKQGEGDA